MTNPFVTLPYDILDLLVRDYLASTDRDSFVSSYSLIWRRRNQLYRGLYHQEISTIVLPPGEHYYTYHRGISKTCVRRSKNIIGYVADRGYEILFRRYYRDGMFKSVLNRDIGYGGHLHILDIYSQYVQLDKHDYDAILDYAVHHGHLSFVQAVTSRNHGNLINLLETSMRWAKHDIAKFCLANIKEKVDVRRVALNALSSGCNRPRNWR